MADEKIKILSMVSEGKITPEEAEKLIDALDKKNEESRNTSIEGLTENKFLYIKVDPKDESSSEHVSVKVPFALLKAGLNIAGLIPKDAQEKINSSMEEKGMSFNFSDINPENIKEIMTALEEFSIDIDSDDAEVKVYCK
ncbi:MAG: hypothetical protein PQJ46_09315 [Spirochaetales bacterium]|nr:hypothetical protein [Spirochaetales bacterium]